MGSRLVEAVRKRTLVPASFQEAWSESRSPSTPREVLLARTRASWPSVRQKTSRAPLVSPPTRSVASDEKATAVPALVNEACHEFPSDSAPPSVRLTRAVVPSERLWTKTSRLPLVSPATRLVAAESKATFCPSSDTLGM